MSGIFGGGASTPSASPVTSLRLQTSTRGRPIALAYGKPRISANLIWYGDFKSTGHEQSNGGKGGGQSSTTYTYTAALILALCEGVVNAIPRVWRQKEVYTAATDACAQIGLAYARGTSVQTALGWLQTRHPTEALAYRGLAYVSGSTYGLGDNADLLNHSFEIDTQWGYSAQIRDANPKDVIVDLLTNPRSGAGFPAAKLGDLAQFSQYCVANNIFISPTYLEQAETREMLATLMTVTNSGAVYSQAQLNFVPFGDSAATANGVTFNPNITPVYDLTDDDFLGDEGSDPVRVVRTPPSDAYNCVKVKFYNRANNYNEEVVEAKDQANIELFGLRAMDVLEIKEICDATAARNVAQLVLQRALYIRNTFEFKLGWNKVLLDPMDLVTLTDAGLGMVKTPVRILTIEEADDGELLFSAEEFPLGVCNAAAYQTQPAIGYAANFNVAPGNAIAPVIFEPPVELSTSNDLLDLWIATGGAEGYGGCEVWLSLDNATYRRAGRVEGSARFGITMSALPAQTTAGVVAQSVNVGLAAGGQMLSGTPNDNKLLNTLCYVGGEFLAYEQATLNGTNSYTLNSLNRGTYRSTPKAHAAGDSFVRIDDAVAKIALTADYVGKLVWVKLLAFNQFGGGLQSLADVDAYAYQVTGAQLNNKPAASGVALNADPQCANPSAWEVAGNFVSIEGGKTGATAMRSTGQWNHFYEVRQIHVDRSRAIKVSGLLRKSADAAGGTVYLGLVCRDASGAVQQSLGGYTAYAVAIESLSTDFARHEFVFAPNTINPAAISVSLHVILGYGPNVMVGYAECQDVKVIDVTEAYNAQLAADAAAAAANGAQTAAATANAAIAVYADDSILSRDEKPAIILDWSVIADERSGIVTNAANIGVSSTGYQAAYTALSNYLPAGWNNTAVDTPIDRTAFKSKFADYYAARQSLLNAIAAKAATMANWASGIVGRPADAELLNSAIVVGGRNLYRRTSPISAIYGDCKLSGQSSSGFMLFGINTDNGAMRVAGVIPKNGTYTVSFDLVVDSAGYFPLVLDFCDTGLQTIVPTLTVQHFALTFVVTNWTPVVNFIDFNGLGGLWYTFSNFNVEEGNKATQWSPAPEDVAADIVLAQSAADAAATAASNAQTDAAAANTALGNIFADNVLSRDEKADLQLRYDTISAELASIRAQADSVSVPRINYDGSFVALTAYLAGLTPGWNDTSQNTTIVRADANNAWSNYYTSKVALLNAITAKIQANAVAAALTSAWTGTTGRPANLAALGGGEQIQNSLISIGADGALSGGAYGQATLSGMGLKNWRVVSHGSSSTTTPIASGIYLNGSIMYSPVRSYLAIGISRANGSVLFAQTYDVIGNGAVTNGRDAATMVIDLNNQGPDRIVVVCTFDEPQGGRTSDLMNAMYRCGASRSVFGSSQFRYRSAYILVGIGGCGEGNGAEAYQGSVDSDTNAWCDLGFAILNNNLVGVSSSYSPRTLADYSYTGDLNATAGAPAGTKVAGTDAATVAANSAAGQAASEAMANKPVVTIITSGLSAQRTNVAGKATRGSISCSVTGGTGALTYSWTMTLGDSDPYGRSVSGSLTYPTASSSIISITLPNDTGVDMVFTLVVTDSKGLSGTATTLFYTHQGAYL